MKDTRIKLCGLSRLCDIEAANELMPDYAGFVFAKKSRRYVTAQQAAELKKHLNPSIAAVGVFVDEDPENIARLFRDGIIDMAQLHGSETAESIKRLRGLPSVPDGPRIIQAFQIRSARDCTLAQNSAADYILLDSGSGTGKSFDWKLIRESREESGEPAIRRPYFLAGGLDAENVQAGIAALRPYAVDVSSGIETGGYKDRKKMRDFVHAVRGMAGKEH